jgi:hypothetical protein
MKSVDDLTYLYNRLIEALKEKPYGPYKATAMIFGKSVAQRMSNQTIRGAYEFLAPPTTSIHSASTTTSTTSSSKRTFEVIEPEDDYLYPHSQTRNKKRRR